STALRFLPYRATHHRHLHSFPTRRSSDLKWSRITKSPPPPQPLYGPDQEAFIIYRALIELVPHRPKHDELRDGLPLLLAAAAKLDRKSTRLNSSHVSISYAVFCLKNKRRA